MGHLKCLMFSHQTKRGQLQCSGDLPRSWREEAHKRNSKWLLLFQTTQAYYFLWTSEESLIHCRPTPENCVYQGPQCNRAPPSSMGWVLCDEINWPLDKVSDLPLPRQLFFSSDSCSYKQTSRQHSDKWSSTRILCFSEFSQLAGIPQLVRGPWKLQRPGLHFLLPGNPCGHVPMICGARWGCSQFTFHPVRVLSKINNIYSRVQSWQTKKYLLRVSRLDTGIHWICVF